MEINEQNIEELIMLYIDAELPETEVQQLLKYIALHPEYKPMLESYEAAVLAPEDDFIFPGKELLLQQEVNNVLPIQQRRKSWAIYAGAAAVLLTILGFYMFTGKAVPDRPQAGVIVKNNIPMPRQQTQWGEQPLSKANAKAAQPSISVGLPAKKQASNPVSTPVGQPEGQQKQEAVPPRLQLNPVTTQEQMKMPVGKLLREISPVATVAINPPQEIQESKKLDIPAWLPLTAEKLEPVQGLVAQIDQVKEKIEEGSKALRNTTFALRIGDRELGFSFKNHN